MTDANEDAEESVYSGSDYDEGDNEVLLLPKKRGTKLNYAMTTMFESKELALEEFSKAAMARRRFCWSNKIYTDAREVLNFRCTVEDCPFIGRLIFDKRDNTYRHEEIDEANPGNGRAPGNQHHHSDDSEQNENERGLSIIQKEWIIDVYSSNFKSKMAIINKMKLQKYEEEIAGTNKLPLIPTEMKLQNFLRSLQVTNLDNGLLRVGAKVTPENIEEYASTHGITSVDRNAAGEATLPNKNSQNKSYLFYFIFLRNKLLHF
jgi:hypothetical protein